LAQNEIEYTTYSYAELFEMINSAEGTSYRLDNAIIAPNITTDQFFLIENGGFIITGEPIEFEFSGDSLIVDKELYLNNVQFVNNMKDNSGKMAYLHHIQFKKKVRLNNVSNILLANNTFDGLLRMVVYDDAKKLIEELPVRVMQLIQIQKCHFNQGIDYFKFGVKNEESIPVLFSLIHSEINSEEEISLRTPFQSAIRIRKNTFSSPLTSIHSFGATTYSIDQNHFNSRLLYLSNSSTNNRGYEFFDNDISGFTVLEINPNETTFIPWPQFKGKSVSYAIFDATQTLFQQDSSETKKPYQQAYLNTYFNEIRAENERYYKSEQRVKGRFINLFKEQNDIDYSNLIYVEIGI
jgi:hypothetical protein